MIVFGIMLCSPLSGMRLKAEIFILDSITKARAEIIQKQNYFPLSAFTWNKTPPQTVKGILGENVTMEWKFSLAPANERFDYFLLLRSRYIDMVKYSHDVGKVIYTDFIGNVEMAKNGTPAFTLINLQQEDDKVVFCCKVGTKGTGSSHGYVHMDCVTLKLLGKT